MALKDFFSFGKSKSKDNGNTVAIDEETLEIAKQLAFEKKMSRAANAKWKRGGGSEDSFTEEILKKNLTASEIMRKVFTRTVEDTVLANRFKDSSGKPVEHLTLKKAVAMDGLRDVEDDIMVSPSAASTMNPEGRFNVPTSCASDHQFAERFNEAMNPVKHGNRVSGVIPELLMDHFASYAAFIGYPMCEVIACHPTVSNACSIPGEDAIAPGYRISFVDGEDVNGNGIPDELELVELGGVKRSLGRIGAMESLKNAIVELSRTEENSSGSTENALNALALSLERLSAYEAWERECGAGEETAAAVNEGFVRPVSEAFRKYAENPSDERNEAIAALSLALSDLAKKEHPVLDEVRAVRKRRDTVGSLRAASAALEGKNGEWDYTDALNSLAVAVERVGAYERLSDRNAEVLAALNMALVDLSVREKPDARDAAVRALARAVEAMDADDFDFVDPDAGRRLWDRQRAEQLERERREDRQAKTEMATRNAEAKENRISELHRQKMWLIERQAEERRAAAEELAKAKGKVAAAEEARADEVHRQKMDIAERLAEQKLRQQQEEFESRKEAEESERRRAENEHAEEEEEKKRQKEKNDSTRIAAQVAKERQKFLDQWKNRADAMGINDVCIRLSRNARVFGIGIAVPIVDGVDYSEPMDFEKIREGAYRGFSVIDPTWIYPEVDSDDLVNPMSPSFFEPKYWCATGSSKIGTLGIRKIHRSWMIIVRNKELPNMLRPMYYYGGIPLTQEIYEAVFCADKLMNEVPKLAMTKRSIVVKGDPNELVTNPEGVVSRLQAMSQVQDNFGYKFVGRNTDVVQMETSLSEFDQVIAKANQRIASIAKMPETKLFKTQLAGMNSAGRYEWDDYSQLLINIQNNWFKPLIMMHYQLDTKSRTGKVIELKVSFNPIDVPTQAEKGESESRKIQTINAAIQGGWLAPAEARTIARGQEDSMFSTISAEMPEEIMQQNQPEGQGMPGMPGMPGGEGGNPLAAMTGAAGGGTGGKVEADAPSAPEAPDEPEGAEEPEGPEEPRRGRA